MYVIKTKVNDGYRILDDGFETKQEALKFLKLANKNSDCLDKSIKSSVIRDLYKTAFIIREKD